MSFMCEVKSWGSDR